MLSIYKCSCASAIDFAAEELRRYLRMMMPEGGHIAIKQADGVTDGICLGLLSELGLPDGDVEDPHMDEILYADVQKTRGIIAGNNPRAVLLAVYEYLRAQGCRWLFPGVDGEYIPEREALAPVSFRKKPSCRYRAFANAAATSQQATLAMIDFLPKIGMNTFMFEFRIPTHYTDSYYNHLHNQKNRPPEPVTPRTILAWKRSAESEVDRRGLLFHDVGHGFCVDAFGIDSSLSWYESDERHIPEGARQYLAEVDGHRGFFHGVPINTNFCMSDPTARRKVAECVADYAEHHENVDLLHVWLADGFNNHCECKNCQKKSPSDWYVDTLNDIDAVLSARALPTKIVFLAYVDTVWAPECTAFHNPDRFVFMLAPFTRRYYDTIPKDGINVNTPPYVRNRIYLPRTLEEFLAFYRDWQKVFSGPAFAFEYHFCWVQFRDFSKLGVARLIYDEVHLYKSLGINGIVEDGDLRPFLPNGIQLYTLARSLFDLDTPYGEIVEDYFSHLYGKDHALFHSFLQEIGEVFDWKYFSELAPKDARVSKFYSPEAAEALKKAPELIARGRALVREHFNSEIRVQTVAVRLFSHYLDLLEKTAELMIKKAIGDDREATRLLEAFKEEFGRRECEIEPYFNHNCFFNFLHYVVVGHTSNIDYIE